MIAATETPSASQPADRIGATPIKADNADLRLFRDVGFGVPILLQVQAAFYDIT